ncbi:MAG: hypothetical protein ACXWLZ_03280 [Rhizomicrobium sp.]
MMFMLVGVVLHVTVLAIVGYLLLYTASRAEGLVALIGRLLGLWVFLLAILSVVAVVTMTMFGGKPFGVDMMHGYAHGPGWMHHWGRDGDRDGGTPPATSAPAAPAKPAPAKP